MFLYMCYTTFIRGTGDSKTPLIFLIVSIIVNVVLLPILMFGWLGLPALGLRWCSLCLSTFKLNNIYITTAILIKNYSYH